MNFFYFIFIMTNGDKGALITFFNSSFEKATCCRGMHDFGDQLPPGVTPNFCNRFTTFSMVRSEETFTLLLTKQKHINYL